MSLKSVLVSSFLCFIVGLPLVGESKGVKNSNTGKIELEFVSNVRNGGPSAELNNFSVLISSNFSGVYDSKSVKAAKWIDITHLCDLAVNSIDVSSGKVKLNKWISPNKPFYIAFRYVSDKPESILQRYWEIGNFKLRAIFKDKSVFDYAKSNADAKFTVLDFSGDLQKWHSRERLKHLGMKAGNPADDDWAISKAFVVETQTEEKNNTPAVLSQTDKNSINLFWSTGQEFYERMKLNLGTNLAVAPNGNILGKDRYSEDGGNVWIPMVGKPANVFYYVVDNVTGTILANGGPQHPKLPIPQWISRDNGASWVQENANMETDKNGWLSSRNACETGITLKYGEHKGRLLAASRIFVGYSNKDNYDYHYSNAIYSDDEGRSWLPSKPFPFVGTGEAALVELSDGSIYYNSRCHVRIGNRLVAYSYDGGVTWTDFRECDYLPDGPPAYYGCKGGLARLPIDDLDVLIFSMNDVPENKDTTKHSNAGRINLTVWASFDGGKTWPVKRLVHKEGGYSSLSVGVKGTPSEGLIFLSCSDGSFSKFNLPWLTKGKDWKCFVK